MTVATLINLLTIVLCSAVLVQCLRMSRALAAFREADFPGTVKALEAATREAEGVLGRMHATLAGEADPKLKALADAKEVAEELGVMVGIANATADRLLETSRGARPALLRAGEEAAA